MIVYAISRFIFAGIFKGVLALRIDGKENIPKKGGFILASNHLSFLDPPVLGVACTRTLSYMGKDTLFANKFSSWWLNKAGVFPVKRNSADLSAMKEAIRRVKAGSGLLLFPEGTRKEKVNEPDNVYGGIGFLAAKLNVPVIPAHIRGTDKALPKGAKMLRPARIRVTFGRQIHMERGMPYQDFARQVMQSIRHLS